MFNILLKKNLENGTEFKVETQVTNAYDISVIVEDFIKQIDKLNKIDTSEEPK